MMEENLDPNHNPQQRLEDGWLMWCCFKHAQESADKKNASKQKKVSKNEQS